MQTITVNYYGSRSLIGEIISQSDKYLNNEPYELIVDSMVISLADLAMDLAKVEARFGKRCMKLTVLGFDAVEGKYPRYADLKDKQVEARMTTQAMSSLDQQLGRILRGQKVEPKDA